MKGPVEHQRWRSLLRSPAVQRMAAEALRNISTASLIASGYLLLFAHDSPHAHRWVWVAVLAVDAVVAFICSVDLQQGDGK